MWSKNLPESVLVKSSDAIYALRIIKYDILVHSCSLNTLTQRYVLLAVIPPTAMS